MAVFANPAPVSQSLDDAIYCNPWRISYDALQLFTTLVKKGSAVDDAINAISANLDASSSEKGYSHLRNHAFSLLKLILEEGRPIEQTVLDKAADAAVQHFKEGGADNSAFHLLIALTDRGFAIDQAVKAARENQHSGYPWIRRDAAFLLDKLLRGCTKTGGLP